MNSSFKIRMQTKSKDFLNFYICKYFMFGHGTLYVLYINKEIQMSRG